MKPSKIKKPTLVYSYHPNYDIAIDYTTGKILLPCNITPVLLHRFLNSKIVKNGEFIVTKNLTNQHQIKW